MFRAKFVASNTARPAPKLVWSWFGLGSNPIWVSRQFCQCSDPMTLLVIRWLNCLILTSFKWPVVKSMILQNKVHLCLIYQEYSLGHGFTKNEFWTFTNFSINHIVLTKNKTSNKQWILIYDLFFVKPSAEQLNT